MKCDDYFNYFDDNGELSYGFGFYIYNYDWENSYIENNKGSRECVIIHAPDNRALCRIPIVKNEILFSELTNFYSKEVELPDGLIKIICKIYKNKVFL